MTRASRWWKCDLQVGTPGWKFKTDGSYDWSNPADRARFAAAYIAKLAERGIEVIALADHNSATWIDDLKKAADKTGITVFPGVEITTGSGSDGVHLIIIGDVSKTTLDFELLLAAQCGFDDDHPRFDPRTNDPLPTPHSMFDILNRLPSEYLVIAPHALGDNGIASERVQTTSLRWKALHHDRLNAVDIGDPTTAPGDKSGWNARFRARSLDHFPCLRTLAFVSTSDAYELDRLGSRYTWIRMSKPSLEGLRQAFLDYEARIICDWDDRFPGKDPNAPAHSWLSALQLQGIANSEEDLEVHFDPHLNVVIGGRGSGKSTVVAALREIYGEVAALPPVIRSEAERFTQEVFASATLRSTHVLATSQEVQEAEWTTGDGSRTTRAGRMTPTEFPVRVINQKELFERVLVTTGDPCSASRNLLALVDESLGISTRDGRIGHFAAELREAQEHWIATVRERILTEEKLSQATAVEARVEELRNQIEALDSSEARERRRRNEQTFDQRDALAARREELAGVLHRLEAIAEHDLKTRDVDGQDDSNGATTPEYLLEVQRIDEVTSVLRRTIDDAVTAARAALDEAAREAASGNWNTAVRAAEADAEAYRAELERQGLDPQSYDLLRRALADQVALLRELEDERLRLPTLREADEAAWNALSALHEGRRQQRLSLFREVEERSGQLRFRFRLRQDVYAWVQHARELIALRSDGFIEEMLDLARWLWKEDEPEQDRRLDAWKKALVKGDFAELKSLAGLKQTFAARLERVDDIVRSRLAAEIADDAVDFAFLRNDGRPDVDSDWQPIVEGSPGQRGAAMLSFVLHHGDEPLVLDQPEDDLDTDWISRLVVEELRRSRWHRQLIVVTHNANIPVNGDADRVIVMENIGGKIGIRSTAEGGAKRAHSGPIEDEWVRCDIQDIMEGGVTAFVNRERKYNNELNSYRIAMTASADAARERAVVVVAPASE